MLFLINNRNDNEKKFMYIYLIYLRGKISNLFRCNAPGMGYHIYFYYKIKRVVLLVVLMICVMPTQKVKTILFFYY